MVQPFEYQTLKSPVFRCSVFRWSLYIYSDKLANQQVMSYCLYFRCRVVHWEERISTKMARLLECRQKSKVISQQQLSFKDFFTLFLGSFQCSYCDVSFFGKKSFHIHANKIHANAISKVWQPCPFKKCKQYFPSFKSVRIHIKECPKRKSSSVTESSAAGIHAQNPGNFGSLWLTPVGVHFIELEHHFWHFIPQFLHFPNTNLVCMFVYM